MSWHNFENGKQYSLNQILETCDKHIHSGGVKNELQKLKYLRVISDCRQSNLVYNPKSDGWGNSPLNPNSWDTTGGEPISGVSSALEDTTLQKRTAVPMIYCRRRKKMDETVTGQSNLKTTADYKAAFTQLLVEMDRVDERMDKDRAEIERLKIETQVIKARTSANLARLQEQINHLSRAV